MVLHRVLLGDHLHEPKPHTHIEAEITDLNHFDPNAIHDNVADEIHSIAVGAASLANDDVFVIELAGSAWAKVKVPWSVVVSEVGVDLGGPFLPLSAGAGFPLTDDLHLEGDLVLDANQKIYGATGHIMAWYQSLDDSMNFGTNGDIVRLKGSALRPVYEQTPGIDKELALLDDLVSLGTYVEIAGDTMLGNLIMNNANISLSDGVNPPRTALYMSDGAVGPMEVGSSFIPIELQGSGVRPEYNPGGLGAVDIALLSDVTGPGGPAVLRDGSVTLTADWDAGTHKIRAEVFESDVAPGNSPFVVASSTRVTDLNADLLDGEHASAFADASHNHSGTYLPLTGGTLTGNLVFDSGAYIDTDTGEDLKFYRDGVPKVTIGANTIEFQTGPIRVNGGLGADLQVWDGTGWAGAVYMNGATSLEFGETGHDTKLLGAQARPEYYPSGGGWKDIALLEDLDDYLEKSGGEMSGDIDFQDDGTGIRWWDGDSDFKSGLRISGDQLVLGDDLTSGDAWEIWLKSDKVHIGYGDNDSELRAWDDNGSAFRTVIELVSGGDCRLGTSDHDLDLQGFSSRPNYEGNELALLSDITGLEGTFPIFACSSTAGQSMTTGNINVEWDETDGRRADSGYTHDTGTNPDEITLDAQGWYLILYDIGVEDGATDGQTRYATIIEYWDGGAWEHIANDGGYENENETFTAGGAAYPPDNCITGHCLWYTPGANTKIRIRLNVSSSASSPSSNVDDECCRIYIEKKPGAAP